MRIMLEIWMVIQVIENPNINKYIGRDVNINVIDTTTEESYNIETSN
jgi:hypothetical protein